MAENKEETGIKYELRSVGGGYSEGSSVTYDATKHKMKVEVNLYGGSKKEAGKYEFTPPSSVDHLISRFLQAKRDASTEAPELQTQIANYKIVLAQEIDKEVVSALQAVDAQLEAAIKKAIHRTNYKFN